MKLKEIYDAADALAPFALSRELTEKYGHYDNSGILVDCGEEIGGVLFALDLASAAIGEAKKQGMNLIFTHHPAIFTPLKSLTPQEGRYVLECARAGISVISAHLNLDAAEDGIDDSLMHALGGVRPLAVMEELSSGGYGKVFETEECSPEAFIERVKKTLDCERVAFYGEKTVKRVASFCGGGFDEKSLRFALREGADTLVSSDGKHHLIAEAAEQGLNVLLLTHYAAEICGLKNFFFRMRERLPVPCAFFADGRFM